jgi:hypothetical protein
MPGAGRNPWPAWKQKNQAAVTTGSAESSGIPCAMVLTVSFVLSPGTGLVCPRHARDDHQARLAPASGCQDHTTSPSASASLVGRNQHVHRIPASRVVTIAIRPLASRRDDGQNHTFLKNGMRIFFVPGLDSRISFASRCERSIFSAREIATSRGVANGAPRRRRPDGRISRGVMEATRRASTTPAWLGQVKEVSLPFSDTGHGVLFDGELPPGRAARPLNQGQQQCLRRAA